MEQYNRPTDLFLEEPAVYAGFWERFGAWFIDVIILIVAGVAIGLIFSRSRLNYTNTNTSIYVLYFNIPNLISLIINWLYFALQESGPAQATIGKRALGLKVTSVDGSRISFGQATGRYFAKAICALVLLIDCIISGQPTGSSAGRILAFLVLLIGYLMMIWDAKKQALHDKLAGTLVVRAKA